MDDKDMKILIITGGQVDQALLNNCVTDNGYTMIIAVDHGLIAADNLNLPLDYIVGDFDSAPAALLDKYRNTSTCIHTFPPEKDKSDSHIAIELALTYNPTQIDMIGATGSRLDHALANIHLLLLPMQRNVSAYILDTNNKIYMKQESFIIQKDQQYGSFVSFLPFQETVKPLTLKGFKYPLNKIELTSGNSLCISNEIIDDEAVVEFNQGILLVFETRDE